MTRVLVVGFGSIGRRHADVLQQLGCQVAVVSRRAVDWPQAFAELTTALAEWEPSYVVVANETASHAASLAALAAHAYAGTVLIEKPLFTAPLALPEAGFADAFVAYNLRFHPLLLKMRELLAEDDIVSVNAHVGQYLPDWRPGSDYRQSYSARAEQGGGALRDLSHELDYVSWLMGGWRQVTALGGHFSQLDITSDDVYSLLMTTARCPVVAVHLNYLDRQVRRAVHVNTGRGTLEADLVKGTLNYLGTELSFATERNTTYLAMHAAILAGQRTVACSLQEGLSIVELVDSAERAASTNTWISR